MKSLILSTFLIGATAKPSSLKNLNRSTQQRGLQDDEEVEIVCHEKCTDQTSCNNFAATEGEGCNTGCISQSAIYTCEQMCNNNNEDTTSSSFSDLLGLFEEEDTFCPYCEFYECCIGNDVVGSPTKYDTCKEKLPADDEEFLNDGYGNNLDQIVDEATSFLNETLTDLGESLGNITSAVEGTLNDLGEKLDNLDIPNFDSMDISDVLEAFTDIDIPGFNISVDDFPMADTADCISILQEIGGENLKDSCNAGCVAISYCDEVCGVAGAEVACDACNYFACCNEGKQFDECKTILSNLGYGIQGMGDDKDGTSAPTNSPTPSPTGKSGADGSDYSSSGIEFAEGNAPGSGSFVLQMTMLIAIVPAVFLVVLSS